MKLKVILTTLVTSILLVCCVDKSQLESDIGKLSERISMLESEVEASNNNAIALRKFLSDNKLYITEMQEKEDGYILGLSDGTKVNITYGDKAAQTIPVIGIDAQGRWTISFGGPEDTQVIEGADNALSNKGLTPVIRISETGFWEYSLDGEKTWKQITDKDGKPMSAKYSGTDEDSKLLFTNVSYDKLSETMIFTLSDGREIKVGVYTSFFLNIKGFKENEEIYRGETKNYEIDKSELAQAMFLVPDGWEASLSETNLSISAPQTGVPGANEIKLVLVSSKGFISNKILKFNLLQSDLSQATGCRAWDNFNGNSENNILVDFSYAGFDHGESAPADGFDLGYTVYNVTDYGAVPNDGISDREAFIQAYNAAIGSTVQNPNARAVLYFPEGEFILHTSADNENGKSKPIELRAGNIVLKGAGTDKTTIFMKDPNVADDPDILYSSPVMLHFKHYNDIASVNGGRVVSNSLKGSYSVQVESAGSFSPGEWVCLKVVNNSPAFIAEELSPYSLEYQMTNLRDVGVQVYDYHQIKSIDGNTVTFYEPLMHKVDSKWGWEVMKYPHYEMVGVEDLTFKGKAKQDFIHHGSWQDDGAYKPLAFSRITNGWLRRVRFTSVSEAFTMSSCSNISVYDVEIDGNRGHSSIRSQGSSRVFIGKVHDHSDGRLASGTGADIENAGQYHAPGVSKQSMGTVLWRIHWGDDSCFEAHATQPRATLIDACSGGWMQYRQGGDQNQVPNHLADLTIWNFSSTTPYFGSFDWWSTSSVYWKFLPPVIVGFNGAACTFLSSQVGYEESHGTPVNPESLYEAQIRKRLGSVPAWLNSLK